MTSGDYLRESKEKKVTHVPPDVQQSVSKKLRANTKVTDTQHDVELSLWDFAGQELYYVTHQVSLRLKLMLLFTPVCSQEYEEGPLRLNLGRNFGSKLAPFLYTPDKKESKTRNKNKTKQTNKNKQTKKK